MRILCISECYPTNERPQYGVFIEQQIKELRKLGNTVDILIPVRGGNTPLKNIDTSVYTVSYKTDKYELFPVLSAWQAGKSIENLLTEKQYDLVAVHIVGDPILLTAIRLCKKHHIAVVAHYHGLNVWEEFETCHPMRQKFYAARRSHALQQTNGLVGVSDKVSNILRRRIHKVPVQTVYNGVDVELFAEKESTVGAFHAIGVGNLIKIKGFHYLLEAFARLHKKHPNTHLDIVGEGVQCQALRNQAQQLNIDNAITFHGKVPYDRVAELMRKSDLFALPSFYEALGCVYLEAMGCHLPTIGVSGMGIDEIIRDGENGLLVRPKDSNHLYEKMCYILENPEDAIRLGKAGYETARNFTWEASAKALNDFYKKCVER